MFLPRNKYPEVTVEKILKVTKELFLSKGFENTSIDEIAKRSGFTKGAIYHHFNSKEELLNAVIKNYTEDQTWLINIQNNKDLNGLEKLKEIFYHEMENTKKIEMDTILQPCLKDPIVIAKEIEESVLTVAPILETIIIEGNKDKSMNVKQPKQVSEMMIILINVWINPGIFPTSLQEFMDKTLCLKDVLEKIGIPLFDENITTIIENYYKRIQKEAN